MQIQFNTNTDPTLCLLSGALTAANAETLYEAAAPKLSQKPLTLDLTELDRIDAAGLKTLLRLARIAKQQNNQLTLHAPQKQLHALLLFTQFDLVLCLSSLDAFKKVKNTPLADTGSESPTQRQHI